MACYMFGKERVRVFETRKGYHVRVEGVKSSAKVRAILGDDPERLYLSELRARFEDEVDDVLFERKGDYREYEIDPLAIPFW